MVAVDEELRAEGTDTVGSDRVGMAVLDQLRTLDPVAYVRFASVYRSFRDIAEFMSELKDLLADGQTQKAKRK